MKVLLPVKGSEAESWFRRVAALASLDTADRILVAHVIDTDPRAEMELGRGRFLGRRSLGAERTGELQRAEEERAAAGLRYAARVLADAGVPEERMQTVTLRGKTNEELRRLAETEGVDLIVVQGRPGKPGPHSLGKTARFLIDHAPGAALLVR